MFAHLTGTLNSKELTGGPADWLILDVNGVGYQIAVSHKTLLKVGQTGDRITIQTALSVRENEWTLFGFPSKEEKELFTLLQSVSGVGPRSALQITGTLEPNELAEAIIGENQKLISQAPGVGAKVAQRIILELKKKIQDWNERRGVSSASDRERKSPQMEEVRAILEGLGYTPTEINLAMTRASEESIEPDVEALVQFSLKTLGASGQPR